MATPLSITICESCNGEGLLYERDSMGQVIDEFLCECDGTGMMTVATLQLVPAVRTEAASLVFAARRLRMVA